MARGEEGCAEGRDTHVAHSYFHSYLNKNLTKWPHQGVGSAGATCPAKTFLWKEAAANAVTHPRTSGTSLETSRRQPDHPPLGGRHACASARPSMSVLAKALGLLKSPSQSVLYPHLPTSSFCQSFKCFPLPTLYFLLLSFTGGLFLLFQQVSIFLQINSKHKFLIHLCGGSLVILVHN